jgi:hypothetical protein
VRPDGTASTNRFLTNRSATAAPLGRPPSNERPLSLRPATAPAPTAREQTARSPTARLTASEHGPPSITQDTKRGHDAHGPLGFARRRRAPCPFASRPNKPSDWVGPGGPPSSHRVPDEKRFFIQETRREHISPRGEIPMSGEFAALGSHFEGTNHGGTNRYPRTCHGTHGQSRRNRRRGNKLRPALTAWELLTVV